MKMVVAAAARGGLEKVRKGDVGRRDDGASGGAGRCVCVIDFAAAAKARMAR